jgi:RND family efflux transporter MFP subunit
MRGRFLCLLFLIGMAGCGPGNGKPASAPGPKAEKPRVESDLARITLTDEAAQSLGIQTKPPRTGEIQDQLILPGWVMVPPGNEVTLTAPVAGYVLAADSGPVPAPGRPVTEKQVVFRIRPVLSPLEQIQLATLKRGVESELAKANESMELAQKEFKRITDLHQQKLRSQQELEQASTRLRLAREDRQSAKDKLDLFGKTAERDTLPPVNVISPRAGTVLALTASPGQYVTAAAPLATIADLTHLWLRVPIPETDLPRLDRKAQASILFRPRFGQSSAPLRVPLVALVPVVDTVRRTADVLYELPAAARDRGLAARDQMVHVGVPIDRTQKESMVPYAAVVYDAHGGAWIYLDRTSGEGKGRVYERRRVELGPMAGDEVAVRMIGSGGTIQPACKADDRVVAVGAGVLFSREFYKP